MKKSNIIISGTLHDISLTGYTVETEEEARRGLGGLDNIDWFECMIFEINPAKTNIFNTLEMRFNIDMLEVNEDQEITKIHYNVKPGIAAIAIYETNYVIELKGGFCDRFTVEVGDKVFLNDVEHRSAIGAHSTQGIEKMAEFEGISPESPDYDSHQIYYDKILKDLASYNNARRKSVIEELFRSHENFDIHSSEPEPIATN